MSSRNERPYDRASSSYDESSARERLAARTARRQAMDSPSRESRAERGYEGVPRVQTPANSEESAASIWIKRVIMVGVPVILALLLFNLGSCIGRSIAGVPADSAGQEQSQAQDTGTESADSAASGASESAAASAGEATASANVGVESPWTDNGRFSTGDNELDEYIKKLCDEHSKEGATFEQNAYDTYVFVTQTDYVERANNQSPWGEGWDVEYAKQYFVEGMDGNCFNFAVVVEYVLKYFGYSDAEGEPCVVHLQSGDWGDHGLVFVTNKADGKRCIVDPALGTNGWMLDIDSYEYDIRNINQNTSIKGNVDAISDEPMQVQPGELTE